MPPCRTVAYATLPHAARAHALLERGNAAAAHEAMAAANALAAGLPALEASHVAYFGLLVAGDAEATLAAASSRVPVVIRPAPSSRRCHMAFAAFEGRDFAAAIDALEPIADELERIGGSHAQLGLVRITLLKAYLGADRPHDARRMLSMRRPHASATRIDGLAAMH